MPIYTEVSSEAISMKMIDQVSGSFIRNNYYIHDYFKTGTGFCDKEGTNEVSKSSTSVSGYSLMNMSSALGSAYVRDSSNMYGNNGYPVLRWQQPMSDDEKTYLTNVPKEIQKKLDRYMMKSFKREDLRTVCAELFQSWKLHIISTC